MSMGQTVLEAKRIGVFTCPRNCKLIDASAHMLEEDISALVVVDDEGYLAGIITRVDLLQAWLDSPDWANEPVQNIMSTDVVTVTEEVCLADVAKILLERRIHRVVVVREVDNKLHPVAVVAAADLIYHMVNAT